MVQPQTTPEGEPRIPCHVAIVMDGNGRWARRRGLPRVAGHQAGVTAVRKALETCLAKGIQVLTLFAFSSENWRRPRPEVEFLLDLFAVTLDREAARLHEQGIRLRVVGERSVFSPELQGRIAQAESITADNTRLELVVAANFGGRWDILQAARTLARQVAAGTLLPEQIDDRRFAASLSLAGLPDPDLFIRTGGETRISNFLLWDLAYTELYFTPALWPDFDEAAFEEALGEFARRERRFGRISEQIRN